MSPGPCIRLELNDRRIRTAISDQSPVLQFAAEELTRYITRLAECDAETVEVDPDLKSNVTPPSTSPDAYGIEGNGRLLYLAGNKERAVLYAVYALLKASGCRWTIPGKDGESLTTLNLESLFRQRISGAPSLSIRCFAEDTHKRPRDKWVDEMIELLDWMAKAGANALFITTHKGPAPQDMASLLPEFEKRGIDLEVGAHVLHQFLPRDLFETQPELFRMSNGKRVSDGNFCVSNPQTIETITENAKSFLAGFPTAAVYHLWADDVLGGSWCECDTCRKMSPVQQQINALNLIAEAVRDVYPGKMIDMLLYHDTINVEDAEKPKPNIYGFYAPRERCYAHAINDRNCARNVWYKKMLEKVSDHFGRKQIYVFEYYDDMILFNNMAAPLTQVISRDLKYYHSIGIDKVQSLMFGRYSWWAYPLNMYVFAELAWDAEKDVRDIVTDYCDSMFETASQIMRTHYVTLEAAMSKILTFCGYTEDAVGDTAHPPCGGEFPGQHLENVEEGIRELSNCQPYLEDALKLTSDPVVKRRIENELLIYKITCITAKAIHCRMRLSQGHKVAKDGIDDIMQSLESVNQRIKKIPGDIKGIAGKDIFLEMNGDLTAFIVEYPG